MEFPISCYIKCIVYTLTLGWCGNPIWFRLFGWGWRHCWQILVILSSEHKFKQIMSFTLFTLLCIFCSCFVFVLKDLATIPINLHRTFSYHLKLHALSLMTDIRIMSYNVQGLQSTEKIIDVFEYIKSKNYDIYCLQDTHFTVENEKQIIDQWGNSNSIFSHFKSNARGVAILFSKSLDYKIHRKIIDDSGNFIIVDMNIHNQRLTLINLYGPNTGNPNFFKNISTYIDDIGNTEIIICGDYNFRLLQL